jgi:hypothetical protein
VRKLMKQAAIFSMVIFFLVACQTPVVSPVSLPSIVSRKPGFIRFANTSGYSIVNGTPYAISEIKLSDRKIETGTPFLNYSDNNYSSFLEIPTGSYIVSARISYEWPVDELPFNADLGKIQIEPEQKFTLFIHSSDFNNKVISTLIQEKPHGEVKTSRIRLK